MWRAVRVLWTPALQSYTSSWLLSCARGRKSYLRNIEETKVASYLECRHSRINSTLVSNMISEAVTTTNFRMSSCRRYHSPTWLKIDNRRKINFGICTLGEKTPKVGKHRFNPSARAYTIHVSLIHTRQGRHWSKGGQRGTVQTTWRSVLSAFIYTQALCVGIIHKSGAHERMNMTRSYKPQFSKWGSKREGRGETAAGTDGRIRALFGGGQGWRSSFIYKCHKHYCSHVV